MKSKYTPNFTKVAEVYGGDCKGKVTGLNEGEVYQFRVRAVNKAGPGEASEPTLPHTAKARFCKYPHSHGSQSKTGPEKFNKQIQLCRVYNEKHREF